MQGECLCSFVLFKHAYHSLLMSVQWSGEGREKKLERNKLMTAIAKETESPSAPGRELQSLSPWRRATSWGLTGYVGGPHFTPLTETGGEACGTCWETQLLFLCACQDILSECKWKVSNQVVYKPLRWVLVDVLVRYSCQQPLSFS